VIAVLVAGATAGIGAIIRSNEGRPAEPSPESPAPSERPLVPPAEAPIVVGSGSAGDWVWLLSASADGACLALTDAQGSEVSCGGGGGGPEGEGAAGVRNDVITVAARSPQPPARPLVLAFGRVPPQTATIEAYTAVWNDPIDGVLLDAPDGVDLNARFYVHWVLGYPYPFVPDVTVWASDDEGQPVGADRYSMGATLERPGWASPTSFTVLDVVASRNIRRPDELGGPFETVPLDIAIYRDEATGRVCLGEVGTNAICGPANDPVPVWEEALVSCCGWPPLTALDGGGASDPEEGAVSWGWGLVRDPVVAVRTGRHVLNDSYRTERDGWLNAQLYELPAEYGDPFEVWVYSCDDCLTGRTRGLDAAGNDVVTL
jgi:hypothetical protein